MYIYIYSKGLLHIFLYVAFQMKVLYRLYTLQTEGIAFSQSYLKQILCTFRSTCTSVNVHQVQI